MVLSGVNAKGISIHALREEGDRPESCECKAHHYFYPRPPRGGRLTEIANYAVDGLISIHALREEGDSVTTLMSKTEGSDFYPRPPRGGRPQPKFDKLSNDIFLSTPSARRATNTAGHS